MILYLFKSTLCLALLLAVYRIFLEKEKIPLFNRGYLLFSCLFSFIMPLLPVGMLDHLIHWGVSQPSDTGAFHAVQTIGVEGSTSKLKEQTGLVSSPLLLKYGVAAYIGVVILLLIRLVTGIESILNKVRRHARFYYRDSTVVLLKEKTAPFSFLNYIFISEWEYNTRHISEEVLVHENAHIRQKHSWDIVFIEILKAIFWFNPLLLYCKTALQLTHEILADEAVLRETDRVADYQKMLLKTLEGYRTVELTSSFNYSQIKRRMQMMNKNVSYGRSLFKMSAVVPLLIFSAMIFGTAVSAQQSDREVIRIEISDSEVVKLNDLEVHVSNLDEKLDEFADLPDRILSLRVHRNAYFGVVLDVQTIMRKKNVLRFRYASVDDDDSNYKGMVTTKISAIADEIVRISEEYMRLSVAEQREEADKYFANIVSQYNRLKEKLDMVQANHSFELPPPPPLPPSPAERLENIGNDSQ